jgi:hypothetical protein
MCLKIKKIVAAGALVSILASNALAGTLATSLTPLNNFPLPPGNTWDPHQGSVFSAFSSLFDITEPYMISAFTGHKGGSTLSMTMLGERGVYLDRNRFGVVDQSNNFRELFSGSSVPGDANSIFQGESDSFTFTLIDPFGNRLTADPSKSADGLLHIFALRAVNSGTLTIPAPSWSVNSPTLSVSVQAGMLALFAEDLFGGGDRDFNDFIGLVAQKPLTPVTDIPEPGTLTLLGSSLLLALRRKRERAITQ